MPAKTFNLRSDCLSSPSEIDVAIVYAAMLWPTNEKLQDEYIRACAWKIALEEGDLSKINSKADKIELARVIRETPTTRTFSDEIKQGYTDGMISGAILSDVLKAAESGKGLTLGDVIDRIANNFTKQRKSAQTINKIWRDYKPVASYWAAYVRMGSPDDQAIPCVPTVLGSFLASSKKITLQAETTKLPHSPRGSILRDRQTVAIPSNIVLPI
jgi:hypothetical protein